ncbi:hypothetical protein MYXE_48540 [Mycobacterium xenopi]|uniref:Uncharacterized protein n=1 Tax=Mycobacterium xenopi TaxID=1789 RepID=A0AAD1H7C7_MYCXE|nr:hypothetical protein MYXE_48540 [Mycobacterium xenopi]
MVKVLGAQRESEGVIVPLIGVQHNASGGRAPALITCAKRVSVRA